MLDVFVNCSWEQFYSHKTRGHFCNRLCCKNVLQLQERNMNTGKYTYIYNMLPWYSSRNILCLLKKLTLVFGSWGRKERRVSWLGLFFHILFEDFETCNFNNLFWQARKKKKWWNNWEVLEDSKIYNHLNVGFFKMWFILSARKQIL